MVMKKQLPKGKSMMTIEKAEKAIKTAYVAAIISGTITLIVSLMAMAGVSFGGINPWMIIDAIFIFGMAYGIAKKSRVCAIIMLVYWILAKIVTIMGEGPSGGIVVAIMFAYFFFNGVVGTFTYHQLTEAQAHQKDTTSPTEQSTETEQISPAASNQLRQPQTISSYEDWRSA